MPRNTRSQAAIKHLFEQNLSQSIHRLPNEVISNVFSVGCPVPNHESLSIDDAAPFKFQMAVSLVCRLWRDIAKSSPGLWTSVLVRPPRSTSKREFYREMLQSVLTLSRELELDVSINLRGIGEHEGSKYLDLVVPHLPRVCSLDVQIYHPEPAIFNTFELPKLRHFYVKGGAHYGSSATLLELVSKSPLETFYYDARMPLEFSSIPNSRLVSCRLTKSVGSGTVKFVESSPMRTLRLRSNMWERDALLTSSTLTYLDIALNRVPQCILGSLPNLLHLSMEFSGQARVGYTVTWPEFPSLVSLYFRTHEHGLHLADILRKAPRIIALEIWDTDVSEAVDVLRARWDGGIAGREDTLRLFRIIVYFPGAKPKLRHSYREIPEIASILQAQRPVLRTEWYASSEQQDSVQIGDVVAIPLPGPGARPSPPLIACAEKIMQEDADSIHGK